MKMNCVVVAVILMGFVYGSEKDLRRIDAIFVEEPCTAQGGICTIATDCPEGHLSEARGLCPKQRSQGIECCHGLSTKETRCLKHGGMCIEKTTFCNPRLSMNKTSDCPEDKKCCIVT